MHTIVDTSSGEVALEMDRLAPQQWEEETQEGHLPGALRAMIGSAGQSSSYLAATNGGPKKLKPDKKLATRACGKDSRGGYMALGTETGSSRGLNR